MFNIFPFQQHGLPNIRVPRTIIDKVLEAIALFFLIMIWVTVAILYSKLPNIIPIHFNAAGEPNDWGGKFHLFILAGIATFTMVLVGLSAYFPLRSINMRITLTEQNLIPQTVLASRFLRALNILVGLLFIFIVCSMSESVLPVKNGLFMILSVIVVSFISLCCIIYYILARRIR